MDRYPIVRQLSRRELMRRGIAVGGAAVALDLLEELGPAEAATSLKVGALHVGPINDHGYNEAMHEGLMAMKANIPGIELFEAENVPESADAERVMENMIQRGAKLMFPLSFGYLDPALNVAKRHPDVIFEHPAGNQLAKNLGTFWSDTTSFEYLMGIVAGKNTKTNKLGWIAGYPIPNILVSVNAFHLGARSVNPKVTTHMIVDSTWVDPAKESQAVDALADNRVDVVTMIVDSPTTVVEEAEKRGIMSMGFHCLCLYDIAGKHWLTGIGFTWGPLFTQFAKEVMNGTWKSENVIGSLQSGYASLAPYGPLVDSAVQQMVVQAKAQMISGELQVFRGPIVDNKGKVRVPAGQVGSVDQLLLNDDWLVEGVQGQTS